MLALRPTLNDSSFLAAEGEDGLLCCLFHLFCVEDISDINDLFSCKRVLGSSPECLLCSLLRLLLPFVECGVHVSIGASVQSVDLPFGKGFELVRFFFL